MNIIESLWNFFACKLSMSFHNLASA